jgi:hypothetical protein
MRIGARLLAAALFFGGDASLAQADATGGRLIVAQSGGAHQPASPATPDEKKLTPEERMNRRFPQPTKAGDLIGLPVLDDYDLTIGYVHQVVRTPQGKIQLIVTQGGWLGPWFGVGSRLVSVPVEVVAILGRQLAALDMPRPEFVSAPTWSGDGTPIPPDQMIKIAIYRR